MVKEELGVNMTLGASNVSFGLPERETINGVFLGMAILRGLNCPIVDAAKVAALHPGRRPGPGPRRVRHALPEGLPQTAERQVGPV